MALRDIIKDGNTVLRKRCREVEVFDEKLHKLLDDMRETLKKADGVGLAAPQVGILKRVCIIMYEDYYMELVNPVITKMSGEDIGPEGCLSCPGKSCEVKRPTKITCEYQTRNGNKKKVEVTDFIARIYCHEIDHLDGILFYDKEYLG